VSVLAFCCCCRSCYCFLHHAPFRLLQVHRFLLPLSYLLGPSPDSYSGSCCGCCGAFLLALDRPPSSHFPLPVDVACPSPPSRRVAGAGGTRRRLSCPFRHSLLLRLLLALDGLPSDLSFPRGPCHDHCCCRWCCDVDPLLVVARPVGAAAGGARAASTTPPRF